jgi:glycosyltransferase involved in cell wall biosynthesis
MSTLSVVVPVLNDAQHLRVLLDLLAGQSKAPDEIIVVDNGSTDDSVFWAQAAGARVIHQPLPGILAAAAAGYEAATGEVIIRCDADTRPDSDWVRRIDEHFTRTGRLDALTGPGRFYDLPGFIGAMASLFYASAYFLGIGGAVARVPLWGSNMAFRREIWPAVNEQLDLGTLDIHDDLEFTCKLGPGAVTRFDRKLRVGAAGRIFSRKGGLRDSVGVALRTLELNGAAAGVRRRWHRKLGAGRIETR